MYIKRQIRKAFKISKRSVDNGCIEAAVQKRGDRGEGKEGQHSHENHDS